MTPDWFSLLPPLVAIVVSLTLRSVIPALFLGVWLGAWGIAGLSPGGLATGLLDVFNVHVRNAVADPDHAAVILFSLMIGGLVGVMTRSGGMRGIVQMLVRYADTRRHGQLATLLMGVVVFIDDYANSLVVGNTMRPVTDRLGISRAKLAYLVDSTSAPITAVALVSTWIGYQVGLIDDAVAGIDGLDTPGYLLFLRSLAYSFYPWLALTLVFWVAWSGRDIGAMVEAERRAALAAAPTEEAAPSGAARVSYALVPLVVLVVAVIAGLFVTGEGESLRQIIGSADSYTALMWGSLIAVLVAMGMPLLLRDLSLAELMEAWIDGASNMLLAMVILVLAWALAATTKSLGTAEFLVSTLGDTLPAALLPALVFAIAGVTALATGTSWGTMGILIPLVVPLAYSLAGGAGELLPASIAGVLAGAIWGDHCSPISDTTVLSSMASDCDHVEHVRTQLPYAMLAGVAALLFGALPSGFGVPWWLSLAVGIGAVIAFMQVFGRDQTRAAY